MPRLAGPRGEMHLLRRRCIINTSCFLRTWPIHFRTRLTLRAAMISCGMQTFSLRQSHHSSAKPCHFLVYFNSSIQEFVVSDRSNITQNSSWWYYMGRDPCTIAKYLIWHHYRFQPSATERRAPNTATILCRNRPGILIWKEAMR